MNDAPYANRELDEKFTDIRDALARIEGQTSKTNGRVTRLERNLLIIACVVGTLLLTNGSELLGFVMSII